LFDRFFLASLPTSRPRLTTEVAFSFSSQGGGIDAPRCAEKEIPSEGLPMKELAFVSPRLRVQRVC
jgi:hypothetical protein